MVDVAAVGVLPALLDQTRSGSRRATGEWARHPTGGGVPGGPWRPGCGPVRLPHPLTMPVRVGPYTLSTTLGKGNYGVVKLGRHERSGEEFAVKVVEKRVLEDDLPVNMDIRREMSILRALCHPNIVALTEVMVSKSKVYLVMELARGGDFFQLVSATGRLGEGLSRRYFRQLIAAVHHCHTRGVFHRDIKVRGDVQSRGGSVSELCGRLVWAHGRQSLRCGSSSWGAVRP